MNYLLLILLLTSCSLLPQKLTSEQTKLKLACNKGDAMSCNNLGTTFKDDQLKLKYKYYKMACDQKQGMGCFNLGADSKLVKKYNLNTLTQYDLGCTYGFTVSCAHSAFQHNASKDEIHDHEFKHIDRAKKYGLIGCNLKDKNSCYYLYQVYKSQDNSKLAKKYKALSCSYGQKHACKKFYPLGALCEKAHKNMDYLNMQAFPDCYAKGRLALKKNKAKAINWFLKGCKLAHEKSCKKLATLGVAKKRCLENQDPLSCYYHGDLLKGKERADFLNLAAKPLIRKCEANKTIGYCTKIGQLFMRLDTDMNRAIKYFLMQKGKMRKISYQFLGRVYERKLNDYKTSLKYYDLSCKGGFSYSCNRAKTIRKEHLNKK